MKTFKSSFIGIPKVIFTITATILLMGILASCTGSVTQPPTPELSDWRQSMMEKSLPEEGCFTATYPASGWEKTTCTAAPNYPYVPKNPPHPLIVGNGNDLSPQAPTGFISTAVGSFENVTNVTSESGQINGTGAAVANAYSIQLNTNFFSSTACSGAAVPANCRGWEQFIFANNGSSGSVFIQYWLISYNTTCPAGWFSYPYPGPTDTSCYRNSPNSTSTPNQPITNLAQLSLSGAVNATSDSVTLSSGGALYSATGGNFVNAATGWTIADFAIVGNAGGGQANFNNGASFVERTRITYGQGGAPNCVAQGFTGETNNLSFGPNKPSSSPPGPALLDQQSSSGGLASCTLSTSVGDTHLTTFDGLLYDFQASGDFILAQVAPADFLVQTRQVSGAPTWPDASVNSAVAAQMGRTQVAVCLGERPLHVDGAPTALDDGEALSLPDGIAIWRVGNVYVIVDQNGYSVRAELKSTWMNVSVGLGQWPVEVHGLLANVDGNVNLIETRDGTVLENPFSFEELYHPYADSWRVPPEESLLSVCGEDVERGIPGQPFYAENLPQDLSARARAVCTEMGVEEGPLLDACILDVAVIGDEAAAEFYVGALAPTEVGVVR